MASTYLTVDSRYLPRMTVSLDGAGGAAPNPVIRALRPKVTLYAAGQRLTALAPYGEPGPSRWPLVRVVLLAGAVALALRLVRIL